MKATSKVKQALSLWAESQEKLEEASKVLSSGPASYYYSQIDHYVDTLFDRFAPFKEGDKIRIKKAPNTDNGWKTYAHCLCVGATGVVDSVDLRDGLFVADVILDYQSWINQEGQEPEVGEKNLFLMSENLIEKFEEEAC